MPGAQSRSIPGVSASKTTVWFPCSLANARRIARKATKGYGWNNKCISLPGQKKRGDLHFTCPSPCRPPALAPSGSLCLFLALPSSALRSWSLRFSRAALCLWPSASDARSAISRPYHRGASSSSWTSRSPRGPFLQVGSTLVYVRLFSTNNPIWCFI